MTLIEVATAVWVLAITGTATLTAWSAANQLLGRAQQQRVLIECAERAAEQSLAQHLPALTDTTAQGGCTTELKQTTMADTTVEMVVAHYRGATYYLWLPDKRFFGS